MLKLCVSTPISAFYEIAKNKSSFLSPALSMGNAFSFPKASFQSFDAWAVALTPLKSAKTVHFIYVLARFVAFVANFALFAG